MACALSAFATRKTRRRMLCSEKFANACSTAGSASVAGRRLRILLSRLSLSFLTRPKRYTTSTVASTHQRIALCLIAKVAGKIFYRPGERSRQQDFGVIAANFPKAYLFDVLRPIQRERLKHVLQV